MRYDRNISFLLGQSEVTLLHAGANFLSRHPDVSIPGTSSSPESTSDLSEVVTEWTRKDRPSLQYYFTVTATATGIFRRRYVIKMLGYVLADQVAIEAVTVPVYLEVRYPMTPEEIKDFREKMQAVYDQLMA